MHQCLRAADDLAADGIMARIIDLYSVKPVDRATLADAAAATSSRLVIAEDHYPQGGLGAAVLEALAGTGLPLRVRQCAVSGLPAPAPGRADGSRGHLRVTHRRAARSRQGLKKRRPMMGTDVRVRRVYDEPSPEDGARVLVDRVWPRGMRKDAARLDEWAKDVAPSAELRTWYRHDPAKFDEFRRRYTAELAQPGAKEALARLRALAADRPVTLLTATRDLDLSQAAVLAGLLRETT